MKGHKLAVVEITERYKRHTKRELASTQHKLFHTLARRTRENKTNIRHTYKTFL